MASLGNRSDDLDRLPGFTSLLAGILGLFVAFELLPLARWCARLPLGAALLAYAALSVAVFLVGIVGELVAEVTDSGPTEYGPGYGTGSAITVVISILSGATLCLLLLIGRWSERGMVIMIVLSLTLGWWLAGDAPFWLSDWVVRTHVFNSFSPMMRHISAIVFFVVLGATSFSRWVPWKSDAPGDQSQ